MKAVLLSFTIAASSTGIFTLQGQPVAGITQSGFYIVNGKKVVIRK